MKENIKIAAKVSGKTALKWVFIFAIGSLVTISTFIVALYRNVNLVNHGLEDSQLVFSEIQTSSFLAYILIFGAPVFIFLYIVIANKISIQQAIYLLWKGKTGDYISSKVRNLTVKLIEKKEWRKELTDKAMVKGRILQLAQNNMDTSKLQRKIISYGFSKIRLDDIDFQDENVNLPDILTNKFNNFIAEMAKPSLMFVWILVIFQIVLLMASIFFE